MLKWIEFKTREEFCRWINTIPMPCAIIYDDPDEGRDEPLDEKAARFSAEMAEIFNKRLSEDFAPVLERIAALEKQAHSHEPDFTYRDGNSALGYCGSRPAVVAPKPPADGKTLVDLGELEHKICALRPRGESINDWGRGYHLGYEQAVNETLGIFFQAREAVKEAGK